MSSVDDEVTIGSGNDKAASFIHNRVVNSALANVIGINNEPMTVTKGSMDFVAVEVVSVGKVLPMETTLYAEFQKVRRTATFNTTTRKWSIKTEIYSNGSWGNAGTWTAASPGYNLQKSYSLIGQTGTAETDFAVKTEAEMEGSAWAQNDGATGGVKEQYSIYGASAAISNVEWEIDE